MSSRLIGKIREYGINGRVFVYIMKRKGDCQLTMQKKGTLKPIRGNIENVIFSKRFFKVLHSGWLHKVGTAGEGTLLARYVRPNSDMISEFVEVERQLTNDQTLFLRNFIYRQKDLQSVIPKGLYLVCLVDGL